MGRALVFSMADDGDLLREMSKQERRSLRRKGVHSARYQRNAIKMARRRRKAR